MEKKWTLEQSNAINHNGNIFISASAGSGKTAILVEKIINQIIYNNKNILNFLILTYTNKAAYEIKSRLLDKLYLLYDNNVFNNIQKKNILEQIILLPNADVTTIHAFCLKLIKENKVALNINSIELNDNIYNKINTIEEQKIIEYIHNNKLLINNMLFIEFNNILKYSNELYLISKLNIFPENYLLKIKKFYNFNNKENVDFWINKMQTLVIIKIKLIKNFIITFDNKFLLSDLLKTIKKFLFNYKKSNNDFFDLCQEILKYNLILKNIKNSFLYNILKKIFNEIKDLLYAEIDIIKNMCLCDNYIKILIESTSILYQTRDITKKRNLENSQISFGDIEHLVIKLIKMKILKKLTYTDIIIDEYQDTSEIQDYILNNIKYDNCFYVGDIKQCIYEFRSANTDIFKKKSAFFLQSKKIYNKFVTLNKNFRSTNKIIRTINNIFLFIMNKTFSEIDYKNEILLENNEEGIYPVEIDILNINDNFIQMQYIAKKIIKIIDNDNSVKCSDIVILFRSINDQQKLFFLEQSLLKNNIDVICNKQNKFINQIEIKTIINFLKIILNPYNDLYFIGCLLSPLFNFSIEEILKVKQSNLSKLSFYEKLLQNNDNKYNNFIIIFNKLRSENLLLSKLINEIYILTSAISIFGTMPSGDLRQKNLIDFILISQKYDNRYDSISFFIERIDEMIKNNEDFHDIKFEKQNSNSITIMSIHQSKGLEFPIVILAEINKHFNTRDLNQQIIIHKKYGIGIKYKTNIDGQIFYNRSIIYDFIKQTLYKDTIKSELKTLYVACTRAMKRLIIIGAYNNIEKKIEYWSNFNQNNFLKNYFLNTEVNSYLPLILLPFIKAKKLISTNDTIINIISDNKDVKKIILKKEDNFSININNKLFNEKKIQQLFSFDNDIKNQNKIISKITASQNNINQLRALSLNNNNYNTQMGSEYHKIMQFIKFGFNMKYLDIENEINKLLKLNILNKNLFHKINKKFIMNFFKSEIYNEILNSSKIWREFRFTILENTSKNSPLIQGIVDMIYIYNNKINIIDFKSDQIFYDYDFYIKKYSQQLNIYYKAISEIFKMPFDKKILFFLSSGEYVCL